MAENIEELKLTIDSVITSNGNGQITGQGLNLVLNDMCDVLGSTGGGGSYYICVGDSFEEYTSECGLTEMRPVLSNPENIALNKTAYDAITVGIQNKSIPTVNISVLEFFKATGEFTDDIINYSMPAQIILGIILTEDFIEEIEGSVENPLLYLNTVVYYIYGADAGGILLNDGKFIAEI